MTALPEGLTAGTWSLDASHTAVTFTVRHAGISKTHGQFKDVTGTMDLGTSLENSSVTATLTVASIDTGNADRDGHLTSADFFDAQSHPAITFESTTFTRDALEGTLTIRGISKPVTLDIEFEGAATDPFGHYRAGFSGSTQISRKEFGLTWNAALEAGGVLVSDTVKIAIDAEFTAPAAA